MKRFFSTCAAMALVVLTTCRPAPANPPAAAAAPTAEPAPTAAPVVALTFPAIAFQGNRTGDNEIYAMNVDGTGQVDLTNNPANDINPVWSPDHTRLAFTSDRDGNNEVYVMSADGSGQTKSLKERSR